MLVQCRWHFAGGLRSTSEGPRHAEQPGIPVVRGMVFVDSGNAGVEQVFGYRVGVSCDRLGGPNVDGHGRDGDPLLQAALGSHTQAAARLDDRSGTLRCHAVLVLLHVRVCVSVVLRCRSQLDAASGTAGGAHDHACQRETEGLQSRDPLACHHARRCRDVRPRHRQQRVRARGPARCAERAPRGLRPAAAAPIAHLRVPRPALRGLRRDEQRPGLAARVAARWPDARVLHRLRAGAPGRLGGPVRRVPPRPVGRRRNGHLLPRRRVPEGPVGDLVPGAPELREDGRRGMWHSALRRPSGDAAGLCGAAVLPGWRVLIRQSADDLAGAAPPEAECRRRARSGPVIDCRAARVERIRL
mmetsp:Transcript_73460/g.191695  ORF Transcript_73460/g.191695 Transcript_73460/m.191695 type:complete len:357 (+) Transcript_73460:343-1413(+)